MDEQKVWGYAEDRDVESWNGNGFETREAAIARGRSEYLGDRSTFWITSGYRPAPSEFMISAEEIREQITERACEEAGDVADEFPDLSGEALKELDDLLCAWANKHVVVSFWIAEGEPEEIQVVVPQ